MNCYHFFNLFLATAHGYAMVSHIAGLHTTYVFSVYDTLKTSNFKIGGKDNNTILFHKNFHSIISFSIFASGKQESFK